MGAAFDAVYADVAALPVFDTRVLKKVFVVAAVDEAKLPALELAVQSACEREASAFYAAVMAAYAADDDASTADAY